MANIGVFCSSLEGKKKFSELAHNLAIKALKTNILPSTQKNIFENLSCSFLGKKISNPIGLAAGFDKNAEVYNSMYKLGFSFVEVGTVTPKSQYGNPKPRMFRLEKDRAIINRLGFNNVGSEAVSYTHLTLPTKRIV